MAGKAAVDGLDAHAPAVVAHGVGGVGRAAPRQDGHGLRAQEVGRGAAGQPQLEHVELLAREGGDVGVEVLAEQRAPLEHEHGLVAKEAARRGERGAHAAGGFAVEVADAELPAAAVAHRLADGLAGGPAAHDRRLQHAGLAQRLEAVEEDRAVGDREERGRAAARPGPAAVVGAGTGQDEGLRDLHRAKQRSCAPCPSAADAGVRTKYG